jgi:hypothetical protein
MATPFSKNRRYVAVIDTDVPGGTGVGLAAMIEVVALVIGDVVQAYSEERYDTPRPLHRGMFLRKGTPKSLYRPGSSCSSSAGVSASTTISSPTCAARVWQAGSPTFRGAVGRDRSHGAFLDRLRSRCWRPKK